MWIGWIRVDLDDVEMRANELNSLEIDLLHKVYVADCVEWKLIFV